MIRLSSWTGFFCLWRDIGKLLRYTVRSMNTRFGSSRPSPLSGAPALLAVIAILVAAPAMAGASQSPRHVGMSLARAASVVGVGRGLVQAADSAPCHLADAVRACGSGASVIVEGWQGIVCQLGPLRHVLPPPHDA